MKRVIIVLIILVVSVSAVVSYYLHFIKPERVHVSESLKAVPVNTAFLVEINAFTDFFEQINDNSIYESLSFFDNFSKDKSLIHNMASLQNKIPELKNTLNSKSVLLSYHILGPDILEQLIIAPLPIDLNPGTFSGSIKNYYSTSEITYRDYDNAKIYQIKSNDTIAGFSFSVFKGLFISSKSNLLVESSIRQLNNDIRELTDSKSFNTVYHTAGQNEVANIYIDKNNISDIIKKYLNRRYHPDVSKLEFFGNWTELDLNISEDLLFLNGFSSLSDSLTNYLNILASQSPINVSSTKVLPDGTSFYLSISANNLARFDQLLSRYLSESGQSQARDNKLAEIERNTNIDLKQTFYPLINSEICLAITNVNILDIFHNSFIVMDVKSQSRAENQIYDMIKIAAKNKNVSYHDYIEDVNIDESGRIRIYKMPFDNAGELLFGPFFGLCKSNYLGFVDNFLILANSKESLVRLIHDAVLNRTMETSIRHHRFRQNFSNRSNMFMYFSFYSGSAILTPLLNDKSLSFYNRNADVFSNFGVYGHQITRSQNMMYNNIVMKKYQDVSERPQTIWESRLDTIIDMKPEIVDNHNNNAKEVIIQDLNNNLYLLSSSGRELWRIKLDEKITSPIYQVDYYKNNRLQYLFSTESKLHLIDRLGNYVERYPVSLRSKSTAGLALFDYYSNRDYRIFIPCEDNRVYLYNLEGNIIQGWEFEYAENTINNPVSYYRHNERDYIVFNDKYKAYILNRRGEERIAVNANFEFSKNNIIQHDNLKNDLNFVATDNKGNIHRIDKDGNITSKTIKEFSENHYFELRDISRNGTNDYVFVDGNKIEVYTQNKNLLFSYELPNAIDYPPVFYHFPQNQIKIGLVSRAAGSIYLINQNGTLYEGFPLHGLTQFSIGYLSSTSNRFNLLVGGSDNLLFNYEVSE